MLNSRFHYNVPYKLKGYSPYTLETYYVSSNNKQALESFILLQWSIMYYKDKESNSLFTLIALKLVHYHF